MDKITRYLPWLLAVFVAFGVLIPSLFFKFSGAGESRHIFQTIAQWSGIGPFEPYGRYLIGLAELLASILLMIPYTSIRGDIGRGCDERCDFFPPGFTAWHHRAMD